MNAKAWLIVGGVAAAGFVAWRASRAAGEAAGAIGRGLSTVGAAIDPTSDQNVFYRGVNAAGGAITGQGEDFSLGTWLYNITHGDVLADQPGGPATGRTGGATGSWDEAPNPFDPWNMPGVGA